jgi:hypothetical protein
MTNAKQPMPPPTAGLDDFKKLVDTRFDGLAKLFEEKIGSAAGVLEERIRGVMNQANFHIKIWMWVTGFMFAGIVAILTSGWGFFLSLSKDITKVSLEPYKVS